MPSADFCPAIRSPPGSLSRVAATQNRSPGVIPAAFHAQSPDLHFPFLMNMDFAVKACSSNVGASYPVLVHRLALLLHASFGPRLTTTPLRFANPSPPSGWVEDFHFRAAGHAQHTLPCRDSSRRMSGEICGMGGPRRIGVADSQPTFVLATMMLWPPRLCSLKRNFCG